MQPYPSLGIIEVAHLSPDALLVHFTDGTYAEFSARQLDLLAPERAVAEGENAEAENDD